jgi:intein/homing endonuclease
VTSYFVGWIDSCGAFNAVNYSKDNKLLSIQGDTVKAIETLLERMDIMQHNIDSISRVIGKLELEKKTIVLTTNEMVKAIYMPDELLIKFMATPAWKKFARLFKKYGQVYYRNPPKN